MIHEQRRRRMRKIKKVNIHVRHTYNYQWTQKFPYLDWSAHISHYREIVQNLTKAKWPSCVNQIVSSLSIRYVVPFANVHVLIWKRRTIPSRVSLLLPLNSYWHGTLDLTQVYTYRFKKQRENKNEREREKMENANIASGGRHRHDTPFLSFLLQLLYQTASRRLVKYNHKCNQDICTQWKRVLTARLFEHINSIILFLFRHQIDYTMYSRRLNDISFFRSDEDLLNYTMPDRPTLIDYYSCKLLD